MSDSGLNGSAAPEPDLGSLAARWWVWASRRPEGRDPVTDPTGDNAALDQPDDVFFLAGSFGEPVERAVTLPPGRPIFFPILNRVCTLGWGEVEPTAQATAESCGEGLIGASVRAQLDGRELEPVYVTSGEFELSPHPDSPLAEHYGPNVAVGYHVYLDPLAPGDHELRFVGRDLGGFELAVAYRLRI